MRLFSLLSVSLVVLVVGVAAPGCDPGEEHPQASGQEHPYNQSGKPADPPTPDAFVAIVEKYVEDHADGLPVQTLDGSAAELVGTPELVKVHRDNIVRYDDNTWFACADLRAFNGDGEETMYDFDFFISTPGDDTWAVELILLHKINGEKQLTYRDNKPVPLDE